MGWWVRNGFVVRTWVPRGRVRVREAVWLWPGSVGREGEEGKKRIRNSAVLSWTLFIKVVSFYLRITLKGRSICLRPMTGRLGAGSGRVDSEGSAIANFPSKTTDVM